MSDGEVSVEEEIADASSGKPHVVLLGAGASRAALPKGDKNGIQLPLLREVADSLKLSELFPSELQKTAKDDFEAAYSRLFKSGAPVLKEIESRIADYFSELELPEEANLYDFLMLSLREKDAIFTFNWDPFLVQSCLRISKLGIKKLPRLFFLHGNVAVGFCTKDNASGLVENRCSKCKQRFQGSPLLFPVEKKNYQDKGLIEREWKAIREYLKDCLMFTIFGYSAPKTDVEAIALLKEGWGDVNNRELEQTEIINRPGCNEEELRVKWDAFIHSHHYEIHGSFYDSWIAKHPRRSSEAYFKQFLEAKFIDDNPVPKNITDLSKLTEWFKPLLDAEG
jgi:hypothetical protein